jgi:hypothetical protein
MSNHPIVDVLNTKFGGLISRGAHGPESGAACILEVVAQARGLRHTDCPSVVGMPDIRAINDVFTDDSARSLAMVRLGVALWDWAMWGQERQVAYVRAVALATIREILPIALEATGLSEHAKACRGATDLDAARAAAAAAAAAARAAAAADAAAAAARAAAAAAAYAVSAAAAYAVSAAAASAAARAASAAAAAAYAARAASAAAAADAADAADARNMTPTLAVDIWVRCAVQGVAL